MPSTLNQVSNSADKMFAFSQFFLATMQGVVDKTLSLKLHIAPCFAQNMLKGVKIKLDQMVMKHSAQAEGVILAYSNVKIMAPFARIMYDCPFTHIALEAQFQIFSPVVGKRISGIVKKQNMDHLGLLVNGVFNASVSSDQIRPAFIWNETENSWVLQETGEIIDDGTEIVFTVIGLGIQNNLLSISGALLAANSGFAASCSLADDADDKPETKKKSKKRKRDEPGHKSNKKSKQQK